MVFLQRVGVAAHRPIHAVLEEVIAIQTPIVLEALHVVATIVEETTPQQVVTGLVPPIVAKVRANN